jgi:hypothetical protein
LEFKHALVFSELICDLPSTETENVAKDSFPDESLFLISSDDVWYRDIIIYIQNQTLQPSVSNTDHLRIRYQACQYIFLGDTLYHRSIDSIFRRCLTYDESEKALNDCHSGACGGHMFGYATAQNIL